MTIDGTWTVTVNSPMGAQQSTLRIQSSDGCLSGKASGAQGTHDLVEGKIESNRFSWKLPITVPFPMTLEFVGAVEGDRMSGNVKADAFGSFPFSGDRE